MKILVADILQSNAQTLINTVNCVELWARALLGIQETLS